MWRSGNFCGIFVWWRLRHNTGEKCATSLNLPDFRKASQRITRHFPCPSKRELWSPKRQFTDGTGNDLSKPESRNAASHSLADRRELHWGRLRHHCGEIRSGPYSCPASPRRGKIPSAHPRNRRLMAGFFVRPFFCAGTARELPCHSRAGRSGLFTFAFVAAG
jgi:hypothetical protein